MNKKCQQEICVICECDFVRQCKPLTIMRRCLYCTPAFVVANGRGDCSLFESRNPFNVTSCNRPDLFTKSSYQTARVERRKEGKKVVLLSMKRKAKTTSVTKSNSLVSQSSSASLQDAFDCTSSSNQETKNEMRSQLSPKKIKLKAL